MKFSELFPKAHIVADLAATGKDDAIREMIKHLGAAGALPKAHAPGVEKTILRREELGTTGIGKGIAIPHAKCPGLTGLCGGFGRSVKGVEFSALDGRPVHLIFMLASSPDAVEQHLEALRKITTLIKDDDFCAFLRRAKNMAELADLVREADDRLRA
jgi:PTS system fructose-specific IIA component/PTS system nitrogen regulatory IIA component